MNAGGARMLFAADIGNSSIDLGVFDDTGALTMKSKISAVKTRCADEYAVLIRNILHLHHCSLAEISEAVIASVVPPLTAALTAAIHRLFGIFPLEVGPGIKTGLNIRIDHPAQLGADIAANSAAAIAVFSPPLIIVDIGTATTFAT